MVRERVAFRLLLVLRPTGKRVVNCDHLANLLGFYFCFLLPPLDAFLFYSSPLVPIAISRWFGHDDDGTLGPVRAIDVWRIGGVICVRRIVFCCTGRLSSRVKSVVLPPIKLITRRRGTLERA
jgi:hypothetical protein